jgi:DNA-binding response OmpR family regulator
MMNILLVDDEVEIIELIELYLTKESYQVLKAQDGVEALNIAKNNEISLAVVDIMMPKMNGLNLIKKFRETMNIPIIVISARDEFSDRILGLEVGADDYVTKPFNPLELIARIKAQMRRYDTLGGSAEQKKNEVITLGDLTIDKGACTVSKAGKQLDITAREYKIIECLTRSLGRVYTKQQIYEYAWDDLFFDDENVIRIHISNLRDKIEDNSREPRYLKTIRGLGYKMENK